MKEIWEQSLVVARLHVLWALCGINDSACLKGVCLLRCVGVEGCVFLAVGWADLVSFFLIILFKLTDTVDQCSPVKHVFIFFPFFSIFFFSLNNGMQYKPAQRKLWCSPAYFMASVALVWEYVRVSVAMSTLHSALTLQTCCLFWPSVSTTQLGASCMFWFSDSGHSKLSTLCHDRNLSIV